MMSTISYIIQIPNRHLKKLKDESYTSNLPKQNTHALLLEKNKHGTLGRSYLGGSSNQQSRSNITSVVYLQTLLL